MLAYILTVKLLDRYNLQKIMEKVALYMKCLILVRDRPSFSLTLTSTLRLQRWRQRRVRHCRSWHRWRWWW